jgi:hypothetical protein
MKLYIKKLLRESLISEAASPVLYHFTRDTSLSNILKTNKLFLTTSVGSRSNQFSDKNYYISFSRTKSIKHGYGTKFTRPSSVRIKLDGNKLNQKYKTISIDYWQYPKEKGFMGGSGDEMEDRIVSDNDVIDNANKYIESIDIFLPEDGISADIIENAKKLGIKLYFYDNEKDFAAGIPKRSVEPKIADAKESRVGRSYGIMTILAALTYKEPKIMERVYSELVDYGYNKDDISAAVDKVHDKYDYYLRPNDDYNLTDLANSLSADFQNNSRSANKLARYAIKEFVRDYKKVGAKSLKDYLNLKLYKGKKTQRDYNKELSIEFDKLIKSSYKKRKEYLDFSVYDKDGNSIDSFVELPEVKKFLNDKVFKIRKYVLDYIENNDDLFKTYYKVNRTEIKDNIDLYGGLDTILKKFDDNQVTKHEFEDVIGYILYDIDDFAYDRLSKIKDEYNQQFYKN